MYCFGQVDGNESSEGRTQRERRLRQSPARHAALAQLHRWCHWRSEGLQGRPAPLDLFDRAAGAIPPLQLEGPLHLRHTHVHGPESGVILIDATLEHFSAIRHHGERVQRSVSTCSATLKEADGPLPRILGVTMTRGETDWVAPTHPVDPAHRLRSLAHYFTALVEHPRREPKQFEELLAQPFRLDYLDPPIEDSAAFASWVTGPLSSVLASSHAISDVCVHSTGLHEYAMTMTMDSEALFPDGGGLYSHNTQHWIVSDDGRERFPRIRHVAITRDPPRRFQA